MAGAAVRPQGQRTGRRADQLLCVHAWGFSAGSRRPVKRLCSRLGKDGRSSEVVVDQRAVWDATGQDLGLKEREASCEFSVSGV